MKTEPVTFTARDLGCILDRSCDSADSLNQDTCELAKDHGWTGEIPCCYRSEKHTLPAFWASYLFNGDSSGMEEGEQADCDAYIARNNLPDPAEMGEQYFGGNDATALAGDVADYTFVFHGEENEDFSQELSEAADEAVDWLNEQEMPPYCSFYFEDNSLFFSPSIDNAKEDVGFVSSREQDYPEMDYEGEWLHVSDHGNATLYVREEGKDKEIWSVV